MYNHKYKDGQRELRCSCEKGTSLPFDRQRGGLGNPLLLFLHILLWQKKLQQ